MGNRLVNLITTFDISDSKKIGEFVCAFVESLGISFWTGGMFD